MSRARRSRASRRHPFARNPGLFPCATIFAADRSFVPAGHEDPRSPGVWKKVLLEQAELRPGTVRMINWARLPIGKSFAPHYHRGHAGDLHHH